MSNRARKSGRAGFPGAVLFVAGVFPSAPMAFVQAANPLRVYNQLLDPRELVEADLQLEDSETA